MRNLTDPQELAQTLGLETAQVALRSRSLSEAWPDLISKGVRHLIRHGHFANWCRALEALPPATSPTVDLNVPTISARGTGIFSKHAEEVFGGLAPWKKGPFQIDTLAIDAEWRSDLKWRRVQSIAEPLDGKRVLDVGTGNGYFLYRACGDGAQFVLGVEPSAHFAAQYLALQHFFQVKNTALLPVTSEQFKRDCAAFDSVLSMGVLYHRRSPLDHLMELKSFLRPGGELVLETIVVDGKTGYSLVPEGRYAQMRNVWFLPTVGTLEAWLRRIGMKEIRTGDVVLTTANEQRSTAWTKQPSLNDFLDPVDPTKTVEGHPAPQRVILCAKAPG